MMQPTRSYKIYTQWSPEYQAFAEVALSQAGFDSFNIVRGTGYWKGQREESMTIEYLGFGGLQKQFKGVAERIKRANRQDAVLVSVADIDTELV